MKYKTYAMPVVGLMALLVFAGQGCPGQSAPSSGDDAMPDTAQEDMQEGEMDQMEDDEMEAESEVDLGTELAPYGIPIPDVSTDRRGPSETGDGVWRYSFMLPDWTAEETRDYFKGILPEYGWEVVRDEETDLGIDLRGETATERVSIGIAEIPVTEEVEVDMILMSPK